jgi:hypothetical protein
MDQMTELGWNSALKTIGGMTSVSFNNKITPEGSTMGCEVLKKTSTNSSSAM